MAREVPLAAARNFGLENRMPPVGAQVKMTKTPVLTPYCALWTQTLLQNNPNHCYVGSVEC